MNEKTWLFGCACLITGLVIGYFAMQIKEDRDITNALAVHQFNNTAEIEDRAFQAYRHEDSPIAIYALNEALDKLQSDEDQGETPFMSMKIIRSDEMLTEGRLAKLYLNMGQTNSGEQHVTEALKYAQDLPAYRETVTNQATLMQVIAAFDKSAKP